MDRQAHASAGNPKLKRLITLVAAGSRPHAAATSGYFRPQVVAIQAAALTAAPWRTRGPQRAVWQAVGAFDQPSGRAPGAPRTPMTT